MQEESRIGDWCFWGGRFFTVEVKECHDPLTFSSQYLGAIPVSLSSPKVCFHDGPGQAGHHAWKSPLIFIPEGCKINGKLQI